MRTGIELRCVRCGTSYPSDDPALWCRACGAEHGANLEVVYGDEPRTEPRDDARGMWRWDGCLPVGAEDAVTLGEGGTPLIDVPAAAADAGIGRLLVKSEFQNPTWSFKDRLGSVAVSWAKRNGLGGIAVSSSGNAGATAAAYAARAGLRCVVFTTQAFPGAMQRFMRSYGAMVVATPTAPERWVLNRAVAGEWGWLAFSNVCDPPAGSHPIAVEGAKTIAYEIYEDLGGRAPSAVVLPVAYGDSIAGVCRGFRELLAAGKIDALPRLVAAEAYPSLSTSLERGAEEPLEVPGEGSLAASVATRRGTYQALRALRATDGLAVPVDNAEALAAHAFLREREGILAELSGAMPLAGAKKLAAAGALGAEDEVVLVVTSGGLKDAELLDDTPPEAPLVSEVSLDGLRRTLSEVYGYEDAA